MTESTELRGDLARLLQKQYQSGFNTGRQHGLEDAKELHAAIKRDTILIAFCTGAAMGLLVGVFAV